MKRKKFFSKFKSDWKSPSITIAIFKSAFFIGLLLYAVVIGQLFVTLSLPIEIRSDKVDVYLRNYSSIIAFALLAQYLMSWCAFNVDALTTNRQMKWFKILTFAGGVAALFKGLISIYFFLNQLQRGIIVSSYYISDVVVWLAMAVFFFGYWNIKLSHDTPIKWFNPNFKRLTNVVVYFFLYKAVASSYYTGVRFNRYGIAWTYFLYDAIAWLFLAAFFAAYTRSNLVSMKMTKGGKRDNEFELLCEQAAKRQSEKIDN